jgi:kumamolisin
MRISVTLTLRERDPKGLDALLAKGGRVSPAQWAASYGPDPVRVAATRRALGLAGIPSQWQPGQVSLTVAAVAKVLERFFRVKIDNFRLRNGTSFYGPLSEPAAPRSIATEVVAVTGMNDYPRYIATAIQGTNGVTPSQISDFYDITPLRKAGIDGSGVTVLFPEDAMPSSSVLAAFATKFGLPPFNVTVNSNPSEWGQPYPPSSQWYAEFAGEAALDLEVVHGLAPGAREIVYEAGGSNSQAPAMFEAMVTAHPTAIFSGSFYMHECEQEPGAQEDATAEDAVFAQAAAQGTSIFWASGDRGAFACLQDGSASTANTLSLAPDATSPHVTAVGGTTVFLSSTGAYYKETAWGEPLEQWGGGGGYSAFFSHPTWQQAPGVGDITTRGVPDVSADADALTGWDVFMPVQGQGTPREEPVGGTSASTPCWAAITALIDEFLVQDHLRTVGFANPALYLFARGPAGLPAPAFHAITEGSNLHYPATPGWNPAVGLGSPDVGHLVDDFVWYDHTQLHKS